MRKQPCIKLSTNDKKLNLYMFQGFGAGNFKALFTAIEIDQNERGNLV